MEDDVWILEEECHFLLNSPELSCCKQGVFWCHQNGNIPWQWFGHCTRTVDHAGNWFVGVSGTWCGRNYVTYQYFIERSLLQHRTSACRAYLEQRMNTPENTLPFIYISTKDDEFPYMDNGWSSANALWALGCNTMAFQRTWETSLSTSCEKAAQHD